ncbi:MAG TPA: hypothetical protein VGN34_30885, partial [Ktedonobacteraceae bacterium]
MGSFHDTGTSSKTLIEHWNGSTWSVVPSPSPGSSPASSFNFLNGIEALSPHNIWAVGFFGDVGIPEHT